MGRVSRRIQSRLTNGTASQQPKEMLTQKPTGTTLRNRSLRTRLQKPNKPPLHSSLLLNPSIASVFRGSGRIHDSPQVHRLIHVKNPRKMKKRKKLEPEVLRQIKELVERL